MWVRVRMISKVGIEAGVGCENGLEVLGINIFDMVNDGDG